MSSFSTEYQKLNPEQRLAVDTLEGPVMVIAGAGTGKTQTIALRIGQILKKTQVNPSNILCLTFTESAAITMRRRLLSLIGSEANSVRIGTFHSFCNSVINDNPQYFLFSKSESRPLDDIKRIEVIRQLIDSLPQSSPLKSLNNPYFFQKDILSSISTLKKENIDPHRFKELIDEASAFVKDSLAVSETLLSLRATKKAESDILSPLTQLLNNPNLNPLYKARINLFVDLYHRSQSSLSELKKSFLDLYNKTSSSLPKLLDLHTLYVNYQESLKELSLYDYEDMILWVLTAFKENPDLLSQYQEQYQYLLVDEFQDTNSSQYQLLDYLSKDQSSPNLFVVGDDDQSIYRFQGASIENVYTFYKRYQSDVKVIALKNNYRSHRLILETSNSLISNNKNRITSYIDSLDKSLLSTKDFDPDPINLFVASTQSEEDLHLAQTIKTLLQSKVKAPEIAVLFRSNADIDQLIPTLEQEGINYLRADSTDILQSLSIQRLLTLIRYLTDPSSSSLLSQVLSFSFLNFSPLDLYKLFSYSRSSKVPLSTLLLDESLLKKASLSDKTLRRIKRFNKKVAKVQVLLVNQTPVFVFNYIIRSFFFLKSLLKTQRLDLLKELDTLYSYLKASQQIEKSSLLSWLQKLDLLIENNLPLSSSPLLSQQENSIRLLTVHKAKGMEFEHVFLYKLLSGKWDSASSRSLIRLPLGILKTDISSLSSSDLEEDRRLFYVALTRAKEQIYLSYTDTSLSGREQLPTLFLSEIDPKLIQEEKSTPSSQSQSLLENFTQDLPQLQSTQLQDYLKEYLSSHYRFNITHLNSYLRCPLCFFFKTILKIPQDKSRSLSFGTAVHDSLSYLFDYYQKEKQVLPLDKLLAYYDYALSKENLSSLDQSDLLQHGHLILSDYYQHLSSKDALSCHCQTEYNFSSHHLVLEDIPLTGKIDKVEFLPENHVNVIDFKTGKPDSKYKELSKEGDYFRQLVFYKLLADSSQLFTHKVTSGSIEFLEKDAKGNYKKVDYKLTLDDTQKLKEQIKEVFKKIQNLEFPPSQDCKDQDRLHSLYADYFK